MTVKDALDTMPRLQAAGWRVVLEFGTPKAIETYLWNLKNQEEIFAEEFMSPRHVAIGNGQWLAIGSQIRKGPISYWTRSIASFADTSETALENLWNRIQKEIADPPNFSAPSPDELRSRPLQPPEPRQDALASHPHPSQSDANPSSNAISNRPAAQTPQPDSASQGASAGHST